MDYSEDSVQQATMSISHNVGTFLVSKWKLLPQFGSCFQTLIVSHIFCSKKDAFNTFCLLPISSTSLIIYKDITQKAFCVKENAYNLIYNFKSNLKGRF